jgi:Caspase domain/TIR domain
MVRVSHQDAERRLRIFERGYGSALAQLASHAALPVVLNPDFVHLLRVNYFLDPPVTLPYAAEADLLLSPLCTEVDQGQYVIDPDLRDVLLQRLIGGYGRGRLRDVARLLWEYGQRSTPWLDRPGLSEAQQLTALNFIDPARAQDWLARAEQSAEAGKAVDERWFVAMRRDLEDRAATVQRAQQQPGSVPDTLIARVALIRYVAPDGTRCVGSGLLMNESRVLTADHVASGSGHIVESAEGTHHVAAVLRSGTPEVDLAVLNLSEPVVGLRPLSPARVDRSRVDRVNRCTAIGFPRWRNDGERPRSAHVTGWVPTAEGLEPTEDSALRARWLTLVSDQISGVPVTPVGTLSEMSRDPWAGMSGAVVLADDLVIGVVRSQNLATGGNSFSVTPVTAIDQLPDKLQRQFWETLGVADSIHLPVLPSTPGPQPATPRPYFYLSYARIPQSNPGGKDDPDYLVYRLYGDLRAEILQMTASSPEEAGFMDRESLLGAEWSSEVTAALAGCRVFVPLYSRRYFTSDWCGREWAAFARREAEQARKGHLEYSQCIVPILWTPLNPDSIPSVAQAIQYVHPDLGERYRTDGIYGLMRLRTYRADYVRAVHRLAQRIVEVAEMVNLPPSPLSTVTPLSGFGPSASAFPTSSVGRSERASAALSLPDPATSSAVLIGTSSYRDSRLDPLPAVANNVADLAAVLADPALWGLPADRSSILLDQANAAALTNLLAEQASRAQDTFFMYFSGHGLITPEGELVLAMPATDLDRANTALPYARIREIVGQCPARRRIVILDCCFSGRALNTMSDPATAIIGQLDVHGTYVMTSAPANSVSFAPSEGRHTAFTGSLLAVMRAGIPGAGELLTLDDLYEGTLRAMMLQGWPKAQRLGTNTIGRLAFLRNRAWSGAPAPDRLRPPAAPDNREPSG